MKTNYGNLLCRIPGKTSQAALLIAALIGYLLPSSATAQSCPPDFGNGQICTANDFNVTGVVVSGPDECTIGETISMTLRVGLESTARERFDIGLFVGDDGGQVIAGSSCSFTSLVPLEPNPAFNPDSGVGGYRDLEGDACGDINNGDGINYRDFPLDSVLCRDEDGDGQVDISGLVTWSSNKSQDVCTDPSVPSNFFPEQSSKCQLEPDFNLPIIVEPEPSLAIGKFAFPSQIEEPGGSVLFVVGLRNTSAATDTLTITSLVDDIHGDLNGRGNCSVPQTLVPGELYLCEFRAEVTGVAGDSETDTVTAVGQDDDGDAVTGMDSATVIIIPANSPPQPSMEVSKTVFPAQVAEPGGPVFYSVTVANTSDEESLNIVSLNDVPPGGTPPGNSLFGEGTCPPGPFVLGPSSFERCVYEALVSGQPGDTPTNTVTAQGQGPGGVTVEASDDAVVTITDVAGNIEVSKIAVPHQLPEPGGTFRFGLRVQNTSPVDTVTIDEIVDDVYGNLDLMPGCSVGAMLAPSEVYQCSFEGVFLGPPGAFQVDTITVRATDDDNGKEEDTASAQVVIIDVPSSIEVIKEASPDQAVSGEIITYDVTVINTSQVDVVSLGGLSDDIYGDITQVAGDIVATSCVLPQQLDPGESYSCTFGAVVSGNLGDVVTDVVLASGVDDSSNVVTDSDSASVTIINDSTPGKALKVTKVVVPKTVRAPGRNVLYVVALQNGSSSDMRVNSLLDDIYDLQGDDASKEPIIAQRGCTPPFDIAAEGVHLCAFDAPVAGLAGDTVTDTVTAEACLLPACSNPPITDSDDATVSIVAGPASIEVLKTASPTSVSAPGGQVEFTVEIINNSPGAIVTITNLVDDIYGDITTAGGNIDSTSCSLPPPLDPDGDTYTCSFVATVEGVAGEQEVNTVTATGRDADDNPVANSDTATVFILGARPLVDIRKIARPLLVPAPGALVTFSISVLNTSALEAIRVTTLVDDIYGDITTDAGDIESTTCSTPQDIAPGQRYSCQFTGNVAGTTAGLHADTVFLQATDDSGDDLSAQDSAYVYIFVREVAEAMDIPVSSVWWLLLTGLMLSLLGVRQIKRHRRD